MRTILISLAVAGAIAATRAQPREVTRPDCSDSDLQVTLDSLFTQWSRGDSANAATHFSKATFRMFFHDEYQIQGDMNGVLRAIGKAKLPAGKHVVTVSQGFMRDGARNGAISIEWERGVTDGKAAMDCETRTFIALAFGPPH